MRTLNQVKKNILQNISSKKYKDLIKQGAMNESINFILSHLYLDEKILFAALTPYTYINKKIFSWRLGVFCITNKRLLIVKRKIFKSVLYQEQLERISNFWHEYDFIGFKFDDNVIGINVETDQTISLYNIIYDFLIKGKKIFAPWKSCDIKYESNRIIDTENNKNMVKKIYYIPFD